MSRRIAIVDGGKIKNIIEIDDIDDEHFNLEKSRHDFAVDVTADSAVEIGGDYDGVTFTGAQPVAPPAVPLADSIAARVALVRVEAMQRIDALAYDSAEAFDIDMIKQDTKEQEAMAQTRQDIRDAAAQAVSDITGLTVEADVNSFTW